VIQLYAGCQQSIYDRPVKELKGFQKIMLQPDEERQVTFDLPARALAVWDGGWVIERTGYTVWVGTSSRPGDSLEAGFRIN
jgi:beta-glucosidase